MAYNRPRRSRPQNLGQNRNVQMRNNARGSGVPFSQGPRAPRSQAQEQPQQCPTGQQPMRDPRTGRMTCGPARSAGGNVPRPKTRNNGRY